MTASLAAARAADANHTRHEWGPFAPTPLAVHLPVAGELTYRFDPERVDVDPSRFATERTHVTFQGSTAWGEHSRFPFHVTSSDWQESDQVLAGIITDFGSPTGAVAFGGRGEFDGVMTGAFKRPRVEGTFSGEDLRAWDTRWGSGNGHIVVENAYVKVTDAVRSRRRAARRRHHRQERRDADRRRVRRLGLDVLLQRRRPPPPSRTDRGLHVSQRAGALGPRRIHGQRQRLLRSAALRRAVP